MPIDKQLPAYKSHKTVWALKIRSYRLEPDGDVTIQPDRGDYAPFRVTNEYWTKHNPEPGGYWVQYEDGYQSYSPAKAFEEGNTLITKSRDEAANPATEETHFLQPKITGYRQLNPTEVALMNEGKALAEQCGAFIAKLRQHPNVGGPVPTGDALPALDQRWISIGATDLQTGFMAVIRGIARPTTF